MNSGQKDYIVRLDLIHFHIGTIILALTHTWQEMICTEVTSCLQKCDLSSNPLIVMADFLLVYDKLQQATMELFGGHSQLALAVKDGFSKAFMSLNEVTGVRVSRFTFFTP